MEALEMVGIAGQALFVLTAIGCLGYCGLRIILETIR